jgi:hypothetical protein
MKEIVIVCFLAWLFAGCAPSQKSAEQNIESDVLTDDQLLDTIQYYYFQYFWDGAEPTSGLARERFHADGVYPQNDKHIITSGGSGFGLMAILVGIERGFITREEGLERLLHVVDFLEKADRFHGVWPHWLNGETGKVQPFSRYDDGGDLVETSFLVAGLIAVKEYFKGGNVVEKELAAKIDRLWHEVEWNWHTRDGENVLYWHWSPNHGWQMNHKITGYNECLITYVLAASSPTYAILPEVYHEGWAMGGKIAEDGGAYGYTLDVKQHTDPEKGGPLFWAHYSYLGLDPRNLSDQYANYWDLNVAHTMINRQHCIENPHSYKGYGANSWGLTASYSVPGAVQYFEGRTDEKPPQGNSSQTGYAAHHPALDLGVISPTAALSSYPYAPDEVMPVIRHFYENLGDSIWGEYGFYDAFSEEYDWYPQRYLAIDQGPVPVMIENHRTGLIWKLFMQNGDVQRGLKSLGFKSPYLE